MKLDYHEVKAAVLTLSRGEQVRLLDEIDLAIAEDQPNLPLSPAWKAEIERRLKDFRAGHTEGIPGEAVFQELRQIIDTE